jgi:hypothetical protein
MSHKIKIKQVDLSGVTQDNSKTRVLVIDSSGNLSWSNAISGTGGGGGTVGVQNNGTSVLPDTSLFNFSSDFVVSTSGTSGQVLINAFRFPSNLTVSLSGGKTFGKYVSGDTIPASGKTPAEVIQLALVEAIAPTVSLTSPTTVQFNQTAISNVLNFSYVINSLGAAVASVSLEWRRGGTGSWTTLSTNTGLTTYTHSLTDTNFNAAAFNYRYTVTDNQGATRTVYLDVTPVPYVAPSISLSVVATTATSPETNSTREIGNVSTVLSGSITRNSPLINLSNYTLQYSANSGPWTDITGSINVSIGPGTTSLTTVTHNNLSLNASTSIAYRVKVIDIYQTSLSSYVTGGNSTVSFYNLIFYGPVASAPANSTNVRALPNRMFTFGANPFNLQTGSVERIFSAAMPTGLSINQVLDIDALNANITANYILSTFTVNNAAGTATSYNVYTMTNAIPYSAGGTPAGNHRHQITR